MKKNALMFAVMAAAAIACSEKKEITPEVPARQFIDGKTVLFATMEQTKASVDEAGSFTWVAGDKISVYTTGGEFVDFTCTGIKDGKGVFEAEGEVTVDEVAAYPAGSHSYTDGALTFNFPSDYEWVDGQTNVPLVAHFDEGAGEISFRHIGGVMKISYSDLPVRAAQLVFTSADKRITGDFTVSAATTADAVAEAESGVDEGNVVTIHFPEEEGSAKVFYVPLPTGVYDDIKVALKDAAGNAVPFAVTKAHSTKNAIERRSVLTMPELKGPKYVVTTELGGPSVKNQNDGPQATAGVNSVTGLSWDSQGNLWFTDRNRLLRCYGTDGNVKTYQSAAAENVIWGVAVNSDDEIFYCDKPNKKVFKSVAPYTSQSLLCTLPNQAICGAFDAEGNLYVTCWDKNVYKINTSTGSYEAITGLGANPNGVVINSKGEIIVTGSGFRGIARLNGDGTNSTLAGKYGVKVTDPSDGEAGKPKTADVGSCFGVCVDENDYIWWIDYEYCRLRVLVPDDNGDYTKGTVTTVAGSTIKNNGENYADGTGTAAKFSYTTSIVYNPDKKEFFIADGAYNKALRKVKVTW